MTTVAGSAETGGDDMGTLRFAIGFLVAPLAIPVIEFSMSGYAAFAVGLLALLFAYIGTFLFGIPAYFLLYNRKWRAFWFAPVAGFVVASLTWWFVGLSWVLLFGTRFLEKVGYSYWLGRTLWPYGAFGTAVASLLWIMARFERGDHGTA
jgi:hypothetical protein